MESTARLRVAILLVLILVALVLLGVLYTGDWGELWLNLGTELVGVAVTYGLLELVIGRRERRESKRADLIAQLGSDVKDRATVAFEELRRQGWLYDGSLQGANLQRANLQGKDLSGANLKKVNLQGAHLQKAILLNAKLQGADLTDANLEGTILQLPDPEVPNKIIASVEFDKDTILPDGTKWTPDTDMTRLTSREISFGWA